MLIDGQPVFATEDLNINQQNVSDSESYECRMQKKISEKWMQVMTQTVMMAERCKENS